MLKQGPTLTPYPNGWYLAEFSHLLKPGDIKVVPMLGQELVLFRTKDGKPHMVDTYCPHMGAHLGHGSKIKGNQLRCAFHGWGYDGESGKCVHIPTGDPIPRQAKLTKWTLHEISGMVLVWWHDQGAAPDWEVPLLPDFEGPWSDWVLDEWNITATIQDVSENDADASHSPHMHAFTDDRPGQSMEIDGTCFTWHLRMRPNLALVGIPLEIPLPERLVSSITSRRYGLSIGWINQDFPLVGRMNMRTQSLCTTVPIDETRCRLKMIHRVRKSSFPPLTAFMKRTYSGLFRQTVEQDITVWEHKTYLTRPVAAKTDAGIMQFRKWARQFYSTPVQSDEDTHAKPPTLLN